MFHNSYYLLIEVIPCFWTSFPLPSSMMVLVVFIIYTVISTIAIVGNGLVIILWLR
jgi:hypothetical protein